MDPFIIVNGLQSDGTSYKIAVRIKDIRMVEQEGNNTFIYHTIPNATQLKLRESFEEVNHLITLAEQPTPVSA